MSTTKEFDILVYGASGFTGEFIVKQIACHPTNVRLAIAGRSAERLAQVVERLRPALPDGRADPTILIADARGDPQALVDVVAKAKVVVNCVGPFRLLGRVVVSACVDAKTDYVDISGEPQHIEGCMMEFHEAAKANGVTVVLTAGFDSIPADVGSLCYTAPKLLEKAQSEDDVQVRVESFLNISSRQHKLVVHTTTLQCALEALATTEQLNLIRKSLPRAPAVGKPLRIPKRSGFFKDERIGTSDYCTLFRGSDSSVVRQSLRISDNGESAPGVLGTERFAYGSYVVAGDWTFVARYLIASTACALLGRFAWGRALILKYPTWFTFGVFSNDGPTLQQIADTSFTMTFHGSATKTDGSPLAQIVTRVSGAEPGYNATSKIVTCAALTILEDRSRIPTGVLTPSTAFKDTQLINRLEESEALKFEVLS